MSGLQISITVDDREFREAMAKLASFTGRLKPVLEDLGAALLRSTDQRFEAQKDPEGQAWKELSPSYARAKKVSGKIPKILQREGHLRSTLIQQAGADFVLVGTNREYAAIHQFGGTTSAHEIRPKRGKALAWMGKDGKKLFRKKVIHPGAPIPARPFLGVSDHDRETIQRKVLEALVRVLKR